VRRYGPHIYASSESRQDPLRRSGEQLKQVTFTKKIDRSKIKIAGPRGREK